MSAAPTIGAAAAGKAPLAQTLVTPTLTMHDTTETKVRKKVTLRAEVDVKLVDQAELDKGTKRDVGGVSGVTGPAKKQKT